MKNRIKHLESNNDHIVKKVGQMDKKKDFYLERRKDKLTRENQLQELKRREEEEIKRKMNANNAFFANKTKEKTVKQLKAEDVAKIK